jgi:hypothetical protein
MANFQVGVNEVANAADRLRSLVTWRNNEPTRRDGRIEVNDDPSCTLTTIQYECAAWFRDQYPKRDFKKLQRLAAKLYPKSSRLDREKAWKAVYGDDRGQPQDDPFEPEFR